MHDQSTEECFPIWEKITVGTYATVEQLRQAILQKGFRIGDWANDVLNSSAFSLASGASELALVRVTVGELGFPEGAYRIDIYNRASEFGLKLCPLEAGPQLRLHYLDQPRLESLNIAMEEQKDMEGHQSQFRVVHGGDDFMWLAGDHKHPDDFWQPSEEFIFTK
jgi:hypothetical protein